MLPSVLLLVLRWELLHGGVPFLVHREPRQHAVPGAVDDDGGQHVQLRLLRLHDQLWEPGVTEKKLGELYEDVPHLKESSTVGSKTPDDSARFVHPGSVLQQCTSSVRCAFLGRQGTWTYNGITTACK